MIAVVLKDGTEHEFDDASRCATDEHNNLCIYAGRDADQLVRVWHTNVWHDAEVVTND